MRVEIFVLLLAAAGTGCGTDSTMTVPDVDPVVLPDPVCNAGTRFEPGAAAFREATTDRGLDGVEGVRLNVADIDGDGYPDLIVRRGGGGLDDFTGEGPRRTFLLRNREGRGFEDITERSGILAFRGAGAPGAGRPVEIIAFADVDGDGDVDAYLGLNTTDGEATLGERSQIALNDGDGNFTLAAESDVSAWGRVDAPAGASFIDFDRDGNVDLFVPQHNYDTGSGITFAQDRLFRGDGTGRFTDVTAEVGLTTAEWSSFDELDAGRAHSRAWGAAACDLDGDGNAELLVPSYGRSPNHLWRNGGGTFANVSVESGYAFDEDQSWQDNQFARCFCASNPTADDCGDMPAPLISCSQQNWRHDQDRHPFRLGGNSAASRCFDVDNDGDLDILTGEIKHWWAGSGSDGGELLVNEGAMRFSRPGDDATGLAVDHGASPNWDEGHMTNAVFDFDNDGWPDVYIGGSDYAGNRGHLFQQQSPLSFRELSTADFFEHNRSHGVVTADFDRDGDLDVIVGHSRARCDASLPNDCYERPQVRFFENTMPAGNFLQLRLTGADGTNRSAIGARVSVTAGGVTQTQEVDGGHGHYGSQADLVLHFGLGAACEAEVTVRWPDAELTSETYTLPAGHLLDLVQGEAPQPATP